MQKILGEIANFLKTNQKKILYFVVPVLVVFATYGFINRERTGSVLGTDTSAAKEAEVQEQIAINKEKYLPKTDWLNKHPQTIPLSAKSAVILDADTNQLLYTQNEHQKLPPASITKVLTAVVVLENMDKNRLCTISQTAADTEPNKITMKAGKKYGSKI
jgi:D-alanyl-D-alanine carboxypeptidase